MKLTEYIFLVVFFVFSSCKTQIDLTRDIGFIAKAKNHTSKLSLLKNNQFEYSYKAKLIDQFSSGTWTKEGNKIILVSDDKYKIGVISYEEKVDESSNQTEIIVLDDSNHSIISAGITVNNNPNEGWNTNEKGQVLFPRKKVQKITIHYLGQKYFYKVSTIESNIILVKIRIEDLSIKYFNKESWILENKKIVNSSGETFYIE